MLQGSTQAVVFFTRMVPAMGEPGATEQVELYRAEAIPDGVDLESREEVTRTVHAIAPDIPPGTMWMMIGYSNN